MVGFLLRAVIVIMGSLVTTTWFPSSLLPLWIVMLAANFFSVREGMIMFAGFSIMSLILSMTWWQIFAPLVLWIGLASIIILTLINIEKKVSVPVFFLLCFGISFGLQIIAAYGMISNMLGTILVVTFKHVCFIALVIFPVKILGEAYSRYINALGISYE